MGGRASLNKSSKDATCVQQLAFMLLISGVSVPYVLIEYTLSCQVYPFLLLRAPGFTCNKYLLILILAVNSIS